MKIVHPEGRRGAARQPPRVLWGQHSKTGMTEAPSWSTEAQPAPPVCMHGHGHGLRSPGQSGKGGPGKGGGSGGGTRSSSGNWFWNWVKQKKSPVGLRNTCTCTCCCCLLLLASLPATCRLIIAEMRAPVFPSWRRHVKSIHRSGT